jgi:hypothetical protein
VQRSGFKVRRKTTDVHNSAKYTTLLDSTADHLIDDRLQLRQILRTTLRLYTSNTTQSRGKNPVLRSPSRMRRQTGVSLVRWSKWHYSKCPPPSLPHRQRHNRQYGRRARTPLHHLLGGNSTGSMADTSKVTKMDL